MLTHAMKRTPGFKTRPNTYSIGISPTNRATCRACKEGVGKGEVRVVVHAFVRPGRSHDFVYHVDCATPALVKSMLGVYGSVKRVPVVRDMDLERCDEVRAKLGSKLL